MKNEKVLYVGNNILLVMFSLLRNYITMKYLNFYNMGLVAMLLSIIEFLGMLQFGLLNGAFRLYFVYPTAINRKINNLLYTLFLIILGISLTLSGIYAISFNSATQDFIIIFVVGIVFGVLSIAKNWIQNQLIAMQQLKLINTLNIVSSIGSILWLVLIPLLPLTAAILGVITQPTVFVIVALLRNIQLRPHKLFLSKKLVNRLITIGFIPFFVGILVKIFDQVERWGIINILSVEDLGKYNLVLLYASLFQLIPNSVMQIFFPKAIEHYKKGKQEFFLQELKKLVSIIFLYAFVALLSTWALLPFFVSVFLPKYEVGVQYVWYIYPYLIAQILIIPLDFLYTITAKYRVMLISYTCAIICFLLLVLFISLNHNAQLQYFPLAKGIGGFVFFIISLIGFRLFMHKNIFR